MQFRIYSLFAICSFIIIFNNTLLAQEPFDCIYAIEACDYTTFNINYPDTLGTEIEDLGELCTSILPESFFEDNTVWIKYKFQSEGDFLFTITSTIPEVDIDFVVFKSETNACNDLKAVRCMFTGVNFMAPTDPACYGPTGLSQNSIDVEEGPGCQIGDDNFLAPLQVMDGEVYYLAIRSFLNGSQYTIEQSGSAELFCTPVAVDEIKENEILVYPTLAADRVYIDIKSSESKVYNLNLYNNSGVKITSYQINKNMEIDIQHLPQGLYFLRIYSGTSRYSLHKFFKSM